ncbi:MAG TPA: oxalurate catabolism protein HpxZ [Gallionella sp.]|nr:oxalurate catabolism protein HpxZ [Gallionella sp.]
MNMSAEINLDHVLAEVRGMFEQYEAALMNNDLGVLDRCFWHSQSVVRFGTSENLYGIDAIRAFRSSRDTGALKRSLFRSIITTFGRNFATTNTEFVRDDKVVGRQSQSWVRFHDGWRIVSAHVSLIDYPAACNSGNRNSASPAME